MAEIGYTASPSAPLSDPNFVFFNGFNKCATTALHVLCRDSGIRSCHWRVSETRFLARIMQTNMAHARRPFFGLEECVAFSDMTYCDDTLLLDRCLWFREIYRAYPEAYYILNTRPVDHWVRSRMMHASVFGSFAARAAKATAMTMDELRDSWRRVFTQHHAEVEAFFADTPRFLRFNIETQPIDDLVTFLAPHHTIDTQFWGRRNVTRAS